MPELTLVALGMHSQRSPLACHQGIDDTSSRSYSVTFVQMRLVAKIKSGDVTFDEEVWEPISDYAQDLIQRSVYVWSNVFNELKSFSLSQANRVVRTSTCSPAQNIRDVLAIYTSCANETAIPHAPHVSMN